jgi:hypothetical protein
MSRNGMLSTKQMSFKAMSYFLPFSTSMAGALYTKSFSLLNAGQAADALLNLLQPTRVYPRFKRLPYNKPNAAQYNSNRAY